MFRTDAYLAALGHTGPTEPVPETLRVLQKRHLMSIPFDNSRRTDQGTSSLTDADIDLDAAFGPVVAERRGGVCFELNGLFRRLLIELGFTVDHLAAGVRGPGGTFGPDLEHMFLGVRLDGVLWLVDVGFAGPGFLEPLRVDDAIQTQYGCDYRVVREDPYYVVERRPQEREWQPVYRFRDQARSLAEWSTAGGPEDGDDAWNWEGELVAADTVIQARSFDAGQMVLVGRRFLKVDGGHETVKVLVDQVDLKDTAALILGRDR
ncbi:arylamine N-acetyltransferase family protein [Streptomyces sp. MAR4 CNX-425]|uniref:arylamine N-acetyltransferase family protein n=1 Tax=Streptomyces sp. MAR4 CNX-425 TaxID=3406343 RepID=UPI003B5079AC